MCSVLVRIIPPQTVTALNSFFLAMVLYPQVQARAQKELDSYLQGRLPDFPDEHSLPYITAIVKEVLRWNPAAPMGEFLDWTRVQLFPDHCARG